MNYFLFFSTMTQADLDSGVLKIPLSSTSPHNVLSYSPGPLSPILMGSPLGYTIGTPFSSPMSVSPIGSPLIYSTSSTKGHRSVVFLTTLST